MQYVDGEPRDYVVLDRKRGLFIASVADDTADVQVTPELEKAAHFSQIEVLINDLATVQNGFNFIHRGDPRLANKWPLPDDDSRE